MSGTAVLAVNVVNVVLIAAIVIAVMLTCPNVANVGSAGKERAAVLLFNVGNQGEKLWRTLLNLQQLESQ